MKRKDEKQMQKYFHFYISTNTSESYYLQGCNNRRQLCPEADKLNTFGGFIYLFKAWSAEQLNRTTQRSY